METAQLVRNALDDAVSETLREIFKTYLDSSLTQMNSEADKRLATALSRIYSIRVSALEVLKQRGW